MLAASSLTDAYTELARDFEAAHPGATVTLSFAGSQTLATQIQHGLRADVFASADAAHVEALVRADLAHHATVIGTGVLVWATQVGAATTGDPLTWTRAERVVLGSPEVPVGAYTDALLDAGEARYGEAWRTDMTAAVVSREPNVRLVLAKLVIGEADAVVVYQSDAAHREGIVAHAIPAGLAPQPTYVQAHLSSSPLATSWTEYVLSSEGQRTLVTHGFGVAP